MFLYPIQSLENIIIGSPVFKVIYIFSALIVAFDTCECVHCVFPSASFLYPAFPAPKLQYLSQILWQDFCLGFSDYLKRTVFLPLPKFMVTTIDVF